MTTEEYHVENLSCATCSAKIETQISALPFVTAVNLDYIGKRLIVQYDKKTINALQRLNQIANSIEPGTKFSALGDKHSPKALIIKPYLITAGIILYILGSIFFPSYSTQFYLLSYLLVGYRVIYSAIKKLFKLRLFDEHFLMSIASLGAVYLGQYSEAIAVMLLYELGQYLEGISVDKSRNSVRRIMALKAEIAHVLIDKQLVDKRLAEVQVGDIISIKPGERVPLDGLIVEGESEMDTSSLTGESEALYVKQGVEICGGFINDSGLLQLKVTKSEAESSISRILNMIENASQRKSNTEQMITRFAKAYTPIVVSLALLLFLLPLLFGGAVSVWLPRALIFLIVSCPCALVISIPLTYYIGIGIAARKGIIFKGSVYLDNLRRVKTLVFDKTGTLTTGKLKLQAFFPSEGTDEKELLEAAILCEHNSNHPLAKAIRNAYPQQVDFNAISQYTELPGRGIRLLYHGDEYLAGSEIYLQQHHISIPSAPTDMTLIHLAKAGKYLGCIAFSDEIKSGMKNVITELRHAGVNHFAMLSGDRHSKALQVQNSLGLDSTVSQLLPEEKVQHLEKYMSQNKGLVAYVGDGLNDAPVLARADIGIAMGEMGNQASVESADIVLMNDKAEQLHTAFQLSQRSYDIARQNIVLALGIKVIVMILGAFGLGNLWEAVIADVGVTLLAIFNAMRMIHTESQKEKKSLA